MTAARIVRGFLFAALLAARTFALDAEGDAWAAALALEQRAIELTQPNRYAEARAAFEAFAKAFPNSVHLKDALIEAAWTSAMDLKVKSKSAEAAAAFDAFAQAHPTSAHANEALVEAGVNWFVIGKSKQLLHRNTPDAVQAFNTALARFGRVVAERAQDPVAGRAQFMCGSTHLTMGELAQSEKDFSVAIEKYPNDKKYFGKSLERRAAARRALLKSDLALADLKRYQSELGDRGEDIESVKRFLGYARMFGKPAPPLDVESWIQGAPTTLEKLRGDVVVLYFFATWCPVCAREREHVLDIVARYEPLGVKFIGVMTHSQGTTLETARPFLAANKYEFPVIMDRGSTVNAYQSSKIPDVVLIDRAGRVRWHDNPVNLQEATLEALIIEDVAVPAPKSPPATKTH